MNLFELLTYHDDYKIIMENMLSDDFYFMQDRNYLIHTIKEDGVVIGIIASNLFNTTLIIELCYILPSYRGKGIFVRELKKILNDYGDVAIELPNHYLMGSLEKYGLATRKDNILVSKVKLTFVHNDIRVFSRKYDLVRCGVVFLDIISPVLSFDKNVMER